ncbi:MAG: hypothetical protein ACTH8F_11615, partial [Microbacterium sp.]|uniref:hypothetical protein n=1 Tax=Microbacterium sp. TaxID=51671 RepID=UPI003F970AC3
MAGAPIPLVSLANDATLVTQISRRSGASPREVRAAIGLSRPTARGGTRNASTHERAAAWRKLFDEGSLTVNGRRIDVGITRVTPRDGEDGPNKITRSTESTTETEHKGGFSKSVAAAAVFVASLPFGPVVPVPGASSTKASEEKFKNHGEQQNSASAGPAPKPFALTVEVTSGNRTEQVLVDGHLTVPDLTRTNTEQPVQYGNTSAAAAAPPRDVVDLDGLSPVPVTREWERPSSKLSIQDSRAVTDLLMRPHSADAKGEKAKISVRTDDPARVTYLGTTTGDSTLTGSSNFVNGRSVESEVSGALISLPEVVEGVLIGGRLRAAYGGSAGRAKERSLKESTTRSDTKLAMYSVTRTMYRTPAAGPVQRALTNQTPRPEAFTVTSTFAVPVAEAVHRGLRVPLQEHDAVAPVPAPPAERPVVPTRYDPRRDAVMRTPKDLPGALEQRLNLSPKGKAALHEAFAGKHGPEALHRATTDGVTVTWDEGGRTHRVQVRADITLHDPVAAAPSKSSHEDSATRAIETSAGSKSGQSFHFGTLIDLPAKLGYFLMFAGAGRDAGKSTAVVRSVNNAVTSEATNDVTYHPGTVHLQVNHDAAKNPGFMQRTFLGGRMWGSGPAEQRLQQVTNVHFDHDETAMVSRENIGPQSLADGPVAETVVGRAAPSATPVDLSRFSKFAKVESVGDIDAHKTLLETSFSKRSRLFLTGEQSTRRSPWGSGNFSSWGTGKMRVGGREVIFPQSPFTKPNTKSAAAIDTIGGAKGLRNVIYEGLNGRSVSTGVFNQPGIIR